MSAKNKERIYQLIINVIFIIICSLVVFPFLLVLGVSLSNETDVINHGYSMIPEHFDLSAYVYIWKNPTSVLNAYKVTAVFTVIYTVLGVFLMSMLAFMLSKRNLKGKNIIAFFVYFTTLFSAGLAPTYIWITQYLNLGDTIWVYILPSLISPWYVFMLRTFFQNIPFDITESAKIDGASEFRIFIQIIIPLSKPVIAAVSLFMMLAKWNDWYTAMLYINEEELVSIQYLLQRMMANIQMMQSEGMLDFANTTEIPSETIRMAMAVVVAGPILLVFPFFQKYFVKGLTVGAVKG